MPPEKPTRKVLRYVFWALGLIVCALAALWATYMILWANWISATPQADEINWRGTATVWIIVLIAAVTAGIALIVHIAIKTDPLRSRRNRNSIQSPLDPTPAVPADPPLRP